jgi:Fur family ferric uptake transcriptional regulator
LPTLIRNTRQRTVIRDVLDQAARPLGAPEILAYAQLQAKGIGIATVYRTIKALVEEGWLVPVELPGEPPRYERAGKEHHHHFLCRQCSRMFELTGCVQNLKGLLPAGFEVTGHDVLLYGACAECHSTGRRKSGSSNTAV